LCHHGALVTDYNSDSFDPAAALTENTRDLNATLTAFRASGSQRVLLTASVFAGGEGAGSEGLPHMSPYGLSKALTTETFRYYCSRLELSLGIFVIPNPFGPFEEPRFTTYLIRSWYAGEIPCVRTPAYVRDNIHIDLLKRAYVKFAETFAGPISRIAPSGYISTQGDFARRLAEAMAPRLQLPCPLELAHQTEFAEPRVRIGCDFLDHAALGHKEEAAWDELSAFYRRSYGSTAIAE
jgi:UDP-glucose 4-epimerase